MYIHTADDLWSPPPLGGAKFKVATTALPAVGNIVYFIYDIEKRKFSQLQN